MVTAPDHSAGAATPSIVSSAKAGASGGQPWLELSQVILNLAINARDAMPDGGELSIRLEDFEVTGQGADPTAVPPGAYVRLTVSDTGVGTAAETRARFWEPFFTTKAAGKATGFGLPIVYGIVTQSGGVVTVESEPGEDRCSPSTCRRWRASLPVVSRPSRTSDRCPPGPARSFSVTTTSR